MISPVEFISTGKAGFETKRTRYGARTLSSIEAAQVAAFIARTVARWDADGVPMRNRGSK
jgi:hypothetical protein